MCQGYSAAKDLGNIGLDRKLDPQHMPLITGSINFVPWDRAKKTCSGNHVPQLSHVNAER